MTAPGLAGLAVVPHYSVETSTLANGLTLHVSVDRAAPVAAVNVWYAVGSRHEAPGRTGFAHLFEHVMFQGSRHLAKAEHLELMQAVGADVNGTTSFERTNYYETVPVQHLDLALWAEADRMGSLLDALDQANLDNQREVVKNEKRQRYDNQPYGTLWQHLVEVSFPDGHPYQHLPIGSMADLEAATLDDVRSFFTTWYVPGNAHLAVVGDVEPDAVRAAVETYFGGIDPGVVPAQPGPAAPATCAQRREIGDKVAITRVSIAHPAPALGAPGSYAASLCAALLGSGKGALLRQRLAVERGLVHDAPGAQTMQLAGTSSLLVADLHLRDGVAPAAAEEAYLAVLDEVLARGVTVAELTRAKALSVASAINGLGDVTRRADEINEGATLLGKPEVINGWVPELLAVTPDEVVAELARLRSAAAVVTVVPESGS